VIKEQLSKNDFQEILARYNIGNFKSAKYIDTAIENANYKLITSKGKFALKVFESKDIVRLKFQNNLINYLDSKKVKVAPLVHTKKNKDIMKYKGRFVSIFKFIEGDHLQKLSTKQVVNLGKEVSKFHKALLGFKGGNKRRPLYSKDDHKIFAGKKLKMSIIHGDLGRQNVLFNGDEVNALIDFNDAHYNYLVGDLATTINSFFIEKSQIHLLKLFMKEYEKNKVLKLTDDEKELLPYFIKLRIERVIDWIRETIKKKQYKSSQLPYLNKALKNFETKAKFLENKL